jgi:hypothetical protein
MYGFERYAIFAPQRKLEQREVAHLSEFLDHEVSSPHTPVAEEALQAPTRLSKTVNYLWDNRYFDWMIKNVVFCTNVPHYSNFRKGDTNVTLLETPDPQVVLLQIYFEEFNMVIYAHIRAHSDTVTFLDRDHSEITTITDGEDVECFVHSIWTTVYSEF